MEWRVLELLSSYYAWISRRVLELRNVLSSYYALRFLTKLLTEDLPRLFVRPKKIVLDFQKGKAVVPVPNDSKAGDAQDGKAAGPMKNDSKAAEIQEGNSDFAGELSVTLLDARKLSYVFYGKTDPYVILRLGDQVIRSKRNSQTTVIGPPGEPIWNQDFHMLVANPKKQKLYVEVKDSLGFRDLTVGTAEVDLGSLKGTVPADRIVVLRGGWSLFGKGSAGELLLRMTYKAYVEDEEDEKLEKAPTISESTMDELSDSDESDISMTEQLGNGFVMEATKESFIDALAALLVSEEFRGIVTSEPVNTKSVTGGKDTNSDNGRDANLSSLNNRDVGSAQQNLELESSSSGGSSALFWLAVITSISVLIALNMDNSSLFNP